MGKRSVSKKIATGIAIGVTALSLLVPALVTAPAVYAESDAQNGPAYDFGRGGAKMPGGAGRRWPPP